VALATLVAWSAAHEKRLSKTNPVTRNPPAHTAWPTLKLHIQRIAANKGGDPLAIGLAMDIW